MVCLALALSAIVLAAPGFAIAATLGAGQSAPASLINHGGVAEKYLMLSRVEWVKRTVRWTNRPHSTPPSTLSSGEGHRRCSRHKTLGRRARLELEERELANFSEIGGPQESEMLMPGENGQLVSAVIRPGDFRSR
jgi:hypothetical protein